jgi:hypothetical protein
MAAHRFDPHPDLVSGDRKTGRSAQGSLVQNNAIFRKATPVMSDPMLPLPGLSSVSGENVIVKFDGDLLSSEF